LGSAATDDYYAGMNRALEYVDRHLAEDLSLRALSRVSGYSEFHFHRLFHAVTGRTVHEYVLRCRVFAAAGLLLHGRASVTRVALDCGFSSPSAFTRCFKQLMGCSPTAYRTRREPGRPPGPVAARRGAYAPNPALDALFSVVTLPDIRVAGVYAKGLSPAFASEEIEGAFRKLFSWVEETRPAEAGPFPVMGVTLDTPEIVSLRECRYFACVPACDAMKPKGEICVRSFGTGGRCIRFSLVRTRPDFAGVFFETTDYLYGHYLPQAGRRPDNRPFLEIYTQSGRDTVVTFHVPVDG